MEEENSPISSTNSSSYPSLSSSSLSETRTNLSTDLRLGLSLSYSSIYEESSNTRQELSDWPPIKPHRRSMLKEKAKYIKVYMEGVTIGRKLDLCMFDGYERLITTLRHMFRTNITYENKIRSSKAHVLTYEDQEGDWMLVGDVPWELFLNTVKRLKITRADKC